MFIAVLFVIASNWNNWNVHRETNYVIYIYIYIYVHIYNGISFNILNKYITGRWNNVHGFQNNNVGWKNSYKNSVII